MTSVIETRNLTKVFDQTTVVNQLNLNVQKGTIYGLVGANGAGKTTLLKLLIGYYWPTSGEVRLFNETLPKEAADIRQRVHFLDTEGSIFKTSRISELVKYYSLLYNRFDESRCQKLFDALELPGRGLVRHLSLGMMTQLRLALTLSCHPDILLLDEPTNGLDPVIKRQFLQLLVQEAAEAGTTILLATHNLDDIDSIADGVAVMYHGQLVASGLLDDLKATIKEIHVVMPNGLPEDVHRRPEIVSWEQKGNLYILIVEGSPGFIIESLHAHGAIYVDIANLSFDELFRRLMEKEGYTRETLLL